MKDFLPFLRLVVRAIVRALVPALFDEARKTVRDTAEDSLPQSAWRLQRRALKEASINVELLYSPGDPVFKLLFAAYDNGTPVGVFVSDGFDSGLLCDVSVTEFSQPQPLEEAVLVKATLLPTFTTRYPVWIEAVA